VAVPVFIAFHHDDPVCFIDGEVEPGELLRTGATELNHGFTVWSIPGGLEEFEEPFLFPFPPLHPPLGVIPFEMLIQIAGMGEPSIAAFRCADVRTVVVMDHLVPLKVVRRREIGTTLRYIALVRPLTSMCQLMPSGIARSHCLAALPELAENFTVLQPLPFQGPPPAFGW
jgi:hypothetical protein